MKKVILGLLLIGLISSCTVRVYLTDTNTKDPVYGAINPTEITTGITWATFLSNLNGNFDQIKEALDTVDMELGASETFEVEDFNATGVGDVVLNISPTIYYAPRSTGTVTASIGITSTMLSRMIYFDTAAAIDITADPQIVNGISGQIITIIGSSDTNTLTLDDGAGLRLSAQMILGIGDTITLLYDATIGDWVELCRSNN